MKILIVLSVLLAGCYWPSVKSDIDNGLSLVNKDGVLQPTNKGAKDASKKERSGQARQEVSKKVSKEIKKDYKVKKTQEVENADEYRGHGPDIWGGDKPPLNHSCKDTILPPPNFTDSRACTDEEAKAFDCWCSLNPLEKRLRLFIKEKTDKIKRGEL